MLFEPGAIEGSFIVTPELRSDDRGFFARAFCQDEFAAHGLENVIEQMNMSFNPTKGTLRGMHWQSAPHQEAKFIRCTAGAVYDVIVDLRPESPTYLNWLGVELSAANHSALYAPAGTAHGYLTLEENTEMFYSVSKKYAPGVENAAPYDDPAFGIEWPSAPVLMSDKDREAPAFSA